LISSSLNPCSPFVWVASEIGLFKAIWSISHIKDKA
jgi:hypothetical protein